MTWLIDMPRLTLRKKSEIRQKNNWKQKNKQKKRRKIEEREREKHGKNRGNRRMKQVKNLMF